MTQTTLERPQAKSEPFVAKEPSRRLLAAAEFMLFLIVGLLLLEPILKIGGVVDEENYAIDKRIGWTPVPNRSATYRSEGYSRYKINSLGMRDVERTIAKPPNTFRIAVLGCSVTEGKQVPIDQTYCRVLENQLNASGGPIKYEVLNFAVSAYTLGQEYLRMKCFALQFKPDLVIFTARPNALLYMGPNHKAGFFNSRPIFGVMPDGSLVEDHHFQNHWLASAEGRRVQNTRWLSDNSSLYALIGKCAFSLAEFKKKLTTEFALLFAPKRKRANIIAGSLLPGVDVRTSKQTLSGALDYLGQVAAAIVKEAKGECDKAKCRFLLAYLPASARYRDAKEAKIFSDFCRSMKIDYVDLNPEFDRIERTSTTPLYVEIHPSKFGHERMANSFHRLFQEGGYLKSSQQAGSSHPAFVQNVN
ncbi:MAG: hypothetical protein IT342_13160 [Candidatus Melainabacteria bacterium]|nr:hypothetical protein [Candidatus Melainabacteria bacterium]